MIIREPSLLQTSVRLLDQKTQRVNW
jgi:hypothetical protein